MSTDHSFSDLLRSIEQQKLPGFTDSRALLHWFLFNVFRLDEIQSHDSVCDGPNDKGIDGVWVDEETEEVFLFQSVYTDKRANTLGDTSLREFVGSANWFANSENLKNLMNSSANDELKALVSRFELIGRLEAGYEVKLVFVTTRSIDHNGKEYLEALHLIGPHLDCWDRVRLIGQQKNLRRKTRVLGKYKLTLTHPGIRYDAAKDVRAYVVPVRASDIASMQGISDRSLFSLNVRLGLGRTRVNKDLEAALKQKEQHRHFVLFHNGVTVICRRFAIRRKSLEIEDYSVVNGCQSAIAFFENRSHLTPELLVLSRFIEVGDDDDLAEDITYRSNNQNGINLRDLRSNDRIQVSLKKEFQKEFGNQFEYAIKAGEQVSSVESVSNDRAGQLIMALYLDEPYNAHQKYRIFGTDYERVFGREVNAAKIYLAYVLYSAIQSATHKIEDPLIQAYQLTKFVLLGLLGAVLRRDPSGVKILTTPGSYLPKHRAVIEQAITAVAAQLVTDFNYYVKEKQASGYYDYKSDFKSPEKYRSLSLELQKQFDRALLRHPEDSFDSIFAMKLGEARAGTN
jgi:hypothetical protein